MLLTITTTRQPATDLGYLLHKHPDRVQRFPLSFGAAHVFYPEKGDEVCTAALLLDIDPIDLIRGRRAPGGGFSLGHYVNDRPYVASSFMSVAIAEVFTSALNGRCNNRPELVEETMPLRVRLAALPSGGGEELIRRLFEPLGYAVTAEGHELDEQFPEWGASRLFTVELEGTFRLRELLAHIYVLIPVLDNGKHYWVSQDEVEKLLRHGEGWLGAHPEREMIARRYLKGRHSLARSAMARLAESEPDEEPEESREEREETAERALGLHELRLKGVYEAIRESGATRVLDLGCGGGKLLSLLLADRQFTEIVGMDVSRRGLEIASGRLRLDRMPEMQRKRVKLVHGSLTYRDERLAGYDAAAVVEVIEHLDPFRLDALERTLFGYARPTTVVMTTPNSEYNAMWPSLPAGRFRHADHRFEWSRAEFEAWASRVATQYDYTVRFAPIGPEEPGIGAPTQMGVFTR